jgi:hypothetical protein
MEGLPPSARLLGIGFYVATCIVLFTVGGKVLDAELDTGRLFTLVGLALGLVCALYGGVRQLLEVLDAINRRNAGGKRSE